jgi:predicted AlkP superfamily phosphohydrolase/phosphomutase
MRLFHRGAHPNRDGRRVFVLGIDGVPYSLLTTLSARGRLPHLTRLFEAGSLRPMLSVLPPISSVAWASFMTGTNPGRHNIYGFVDRIPSEWDTYIPSSQNMRAETLWEMLSRAGLRVVVINVPTTYPPRPVNGVLISGFEATSLERAVYPKNLAPKLREMGYRIDIDPWAARKSRAHLLDDLRETLDRRKRAVLYFLETEKWDFFMAHIMGTDRLHHFLWTEWEEQHPEYAPRFVEYYEQVDAFVGEVVGSLPRDTEVVLLSDHGFTCLRHDVFLNQWLAEAGFLTYKRNGASTLADLDPSTRAYSLLPGRIYVNLRGREKNGTVEPGRDYERVRREISEGLLNLRSPEGEPIVQSVFRREEVYSGSAYENAPDLIALPHDGFELKGNLAAPALLAPGDLSGMHTLGNAFVYVRGHTLRNGEISILDVMPTVLDMLDMPADGLDGSSLLQR